MPIQRTIESTRHPVRIWTDDVDETSWTQLKNVATLPFIYGHVAAMPDVHAGKGATIGSVIPTVGAIIPAAVGVDIGCGMVAARLSLHANQLPDSLREVRQAIEDRVPVGFGNHPDDRVRTKAALRLRPGWAALAARREAVEKLARRGAKWETQVGTLGGGNHFIELCLDESDGVWVMLHSGSRGIGNKLGNHFISIAREEMLRLDRKLPDRDLAYLREGTESFDDYVAAVGWAQEFAAENRRQILALTLEALRATLPPFELAEQAINCHHNYINREVHQGNEVWVTRKGAIRAGEGDLGIIPGSMGARSYIVRGKGNPESFQSCAHGAGRRMSRRKAKETFSVNDLERQTEGVECRKDRGVVDEIPGAYKEIDRVMAQQSDLVEAVHTLKQVVCVKG